MIPAIIIEGFICYGFISLSIDRGNLIWYLLAFIFLIMTIKELVRLLGTFILHGRKTT
jgi:hypothetical protein